MLCLHGAGGAGRNALAALRSYADREGIILAAPDSSQATWDVLWRGYGPDVHAINSGLVRVFDALAVDAGRIAIEGFSDGASYALSLGIANGDLFGAIVAFSPGFMLAPAQIGRPRIFMSHGTADRVLPIDRCSRTLAPALTRAGYDVTYREFEGGHTVPPSIVDEAVVWLFDREQGGPVQ